MLQALRQPRGRPGRVFAGPAGRAGAVPLRTDGLTSFMIVLAVVVMFAVSGGVLWDLGLNYDGITGSPASKIHPATYLTVLLVGWAALRSGNPAGFAMRAAKLRPASLLLLATGFVLFFQTLLRKAPGLAGNVDTFMAPALLMAVFADLDEKTQRRIEIALHLVMLANAGLGLYEFLSGNLLFPYRFEGKRFELDTRSAALQGHPLVNASITAFYIIELVTGGGTVLPTVVRFGMIGLQFVALVTFGGRSATIITLLFTGLHLLRSLHLMIKSGRVPLLAAGFGLILAALVPLGALALEAVGFFDKLLLRFVSDGGSANARIEMFDLFDRLPLRTLWFGPDPELVDSLRRISGLEWGIENPIVAMLLYQGILVTALVALAVVLFVFEVARVSRPGTLPTILAFLILINTSQSIAGKTTLLSKFEVLVMVLYRPQRQPDRRPLRRVAPAAGTDAVTMPAFSGPGPR